MGLVTLLRLSSLKEILCKTKNQMMLGFSWETNRRLNLNDELLNRTKFEMLDVDKAGWVCILTLYREAGKKN